jgi:hypothetical protein
MAVWTVGDILTVYIDYVNKVLASTSTHKGTLIALRSLGKTRLTVVSTGTVSAASGATLYYMEVSPEGARRNMMLYFDSDAIRDRSFRESQNYGSIGQTGSYISSSNSTPGLFPTGLFDPLTQTSSGATSNGADGIGNYTEISTGTVVGNAAFWSTTALEDVARVGNNPYMSLTFMFDQLGAPRFFAGFAVTNADPVAQVLVDDTPLAGIAGVWFTSGVDTNFQFVTNGTGGALTKIDTGVAPEADRLYLLETMISGNGSSTGKAANFWLRDLGTFTTGQSGNLLAEGSATGASLMGGTDDLMMINGCVVATGSTATQLRTYWGSIELNS